MKVTLLHKAVLAALFFTLSTTVTLAQTTGRPQERATRPSPSVTTQEERRIQACQTRETAVQTRMGSLVRFSSNMVEKFEAISLRVQSFYTQRVVPAGGSVENYSELVADIAAKQTAVTTAINTAQDSVDAFSCEDNGDLRAHYTAFRQNMQAVKQALSDYRSAIKNLIVAVRSALPEQVEPTPSPEVGE